LTSEEALELRGADLSAWFNPFLSHFASEARRCGGEARFLREDGILRGMVVTDPVERVASVFTRSRSVAEPIIMGRGPLGMFSEFLTEPTADPFDVFCVPLGSGVLGHRFQHAVRPLSRSDLSSVEGLMREVYGEVNARWFEGLPSSTETGFLAEVDGRIAGVGWVSLVPGHARLHSLTVRAPYRRIGIGTDLLFARLLWAERAGAREAVSEISRRNPESQAIATRGGMRPQGPIYYYPPR
jgi:GNAT superfamily N-acetyltransferase